MISRSELERQVEQPAAERCEYCRMHQSLQRATFHFEYIIPHSRGGPSQLDNLAWDSSTRRVVRSISTEGWQVNMDFTDEAFQIIH